MTKEKLLQRLSDIEWYDFVVRDSTGGIPILMWEIVSVFSNTAGGWIILGIREKKAENGNSYFKPRV